MEDSPLSIAANVAGLLTFVVAIFASIYVRYVSLRNGGVEMRTVWQAAQDNVNDLQESQAWLSINEGDEPDLIWLKKLGATLRATEIVIFLYCARAMNMNMTRDAEVLENVLSGGQWVGITPTTFTDAAQEIKETKEKQSIIRRLHEGRFKSPDTGWTYFDQVVVGVRLLLTVGASPTSFWWYRVRERVLEKVRQRDVLRSRLLSHQVSMANS